MKLINAMSAAGLAVLSTGAIAAEEAEKAKSPWKSTAELGYVRTTGNTETESLKFVFDVSYEVEKWLHEGHAESLSSKSKTTDTTVVPNVTTEERTAAKWLISGQSNYKINDFDYFFGLASYEDDRFSGFEYQAKVGLGYGRRVIATDAHELKLEIGPGVRFFELEVPVAPATTTDRESETLIRLAAGYVWTISPTAKFTEDFTAELGEDQDELKSVTALTANINSSLAMKLSYTIKTLDVVPAGTDDTDTEAAVTLVYSF